MTGAVEDVGRRRYFELQALARRQGRDTQELLTLYALEGWLARLAATVHRGSLVLKGGMLLAVFDQRRPTRDLDLHAQRLAGDAETVGALVAEIAAVPVDDGLAFDASSVSAQPIREGDAYQGVRVSVDARLHTARLTPKVDVNVGDPIWPAPQEIELPRLLGGQPLRLRGYPLPMVLAEKLVTAIARGTASTRWRDFADVYLLTGDRHLAAVDLVAAIDAVAAHRGVELVELATVLDGFGQQAQAKWDPWRRRQDLADRLPADFDTVLDRVTAFADPLVGGAIAEGSWDPGRRRWVR